MFCPNCGAQNPDENRFCNYCGTELVDNQNFPAPSPMESLQMLLSALWSKVTDACRKGWQTVRKHPWVSMPLAVLLVAVLAVNVVNSLFFSPERVARSYFLAVMQADARAAYDCMDIPATEFTAFEAFSQYWQRTTHPYDVYNYSVSEQGTVGHGYNTGLSDDSSEEAELERTFTVRYYLRGESIPQTMTVTVVRGSERRFLLFDNYRVMPSFLATDYTLYVPAGTQVTVGQTQLSGPVSDEDMDAYAIPALFQQEYDVTFSNSMCGEVTQSFYPQSHDSYYCSDLPYSDEVAQTIAGQAQSQLQSIINAAISHAELPANIPLTADADALHELQQDYRDLSDRLFDPADQTGYQSFQITACSDDSDRQYMNVQDIYYNCHLDFEYNYVQQMRNWWNDEMESNVGSRSGTANLAYRYESGQWVLCGLYINY